LLFAAESSELIKNGEVKARGTARSGNATAGKAPGEPRSWRAQVASAPRPSRTATLRTRDGLTIVVGDTGAVMEFLEDTIESPAGLFVRDFAGNRFAGGRGERFQATGNFVEQCIAFDPLDLKLTARWEARGDYLLLTGELEDRRGADRAADLLLDLPVSGDGWQWWSDIGTVTPTDRQHPLHATTDFPLVALTHPGRRIGLALGLSPEIPCRYVIEHNALEGRLCARIKFGLSPDAKPKGHARFELVLYRVDPRWGLRDALRRYYTIFPKPFEKRAKKEGGWLFETTADKVPNPQDFAYHESTPTVAYPKSGPATGWEADAKHGILTMPYIIPPQKQLGVLPAMPKDYDEAITVLRTWKDPSLTAAIENSGIHDTDGRYQITIRNHFGGGPTTFPNVVFCVNCDPDLAAGQRDLEYVRRLIAKAPQIGGIYCDSLSTWTARHLNFRREHFRRAEFPLTYDEASGRVAIEGRSSICEFLCGLGDLLHPGGRLIFPNVQWHRGRYSSIFYSFYSDVCGYECGSEDFDMMRRARAAAYHKPVLYLHYLKFDGKDTVVTTQEGFADYVKRCALYGIHPSIGERVQRSYDDNKQTYDTYMPLIRRIAAAGWEPVTHAKVEPSAVLVERFGTKPPELYFTLYNPTDKPLDARLAPDRDAPLFTTESTMKELVAGTLTMPPKALRVVQIK